MRFPVVFTWPLTFPFPQAPSAFHPFILFQARDYAAFLHQEQFVSCVIEGTGSHTETIARDFKQRRFNTGDVLLK